VNTTVIALVIAPIPAGACCAAHTNSANGSAELIAPIAASRHQPATASCARAPAERQQYQGAERQPDFDQGEGAKIGGGNAHEQERRAPDRPQHDDLHRSQPA
jgi:hypothetical protein